MCIASAAGAPSVFLADVLAQAAPAVREFHGWRTETFGPVAVAASRDLRIGSSAGPGGMLFRRSLVSGSSYRLTITGKPLSGQTTVRLTVGQSPPQWLPAPDGQRVVTFTGSGQTLEVVVYSDTPYEYRLDDLTLDACDGCVLPAEFRGWKLESYGTAEWAADAISTTLASSAGAGGVYFRRTIDPALTYRLQIAGRELSGVTTVRLTIGKNAPRWFRAPDSPRRFTVSGSDSIEVVVYGDGTHSYRLDAIAMDECPSCLTDPQLVRQIHAAIPGLQDLLEHDRKAAARALLNWTANVVDLGVGLTVDVATLREYEMGAAEAYQELWSTGSDGTACGGFADFFAKLLPLFGYEAFTVNFGYDGTPVTHVTTIARIDAELYILDPTFNGLYVNSQSGEPMKIADLLAPPSAGVRPYVFRTLPIARDLVFTKDADVSATGVLATLGLQTSACQAAARSEEGEGRRICHNVPYDDRVLREQWKDDLARLRLQWNDDMILTLMRHRVLSLSSAPPGMRQQFLDAVASAGIPFGAP
jgi:hypothetical protein